MLELERLRPERLRPLRRDEYEKLIDMGVFEGERVELLRGVLVTMSPDKEPHARVTAWLTRQLGRALDPDAYEVRSQSTYAATPDSVSEPDVQVLEQALRRRLPRRCLLVVEVDYSSDYRDRVVKPAIYAENRAPEYWVVDIQRRVVWVHTKPTRGGYARVDCRGAGDVLCPLKLGGVEIAIDSIPWGPPAAPERKSRKRRR